MPLRRSPSTLSLVGRFIVHILAGSVGAATLIGVTVLLNIGTAAIGTNKLLSTSFIWPLDVLEYVIFYGDILIFLYFFVREGVRFMKAIT